MCLKNLTFVTVCLFYTLIAAAQRNFDHYNRLGVTGGFNLFDINTSDLITSQESGFMAGFTTRGSFRNQFDLIYGISFFNNKVGIQGFLPSNSQGQFQRQNLKYTIQAVQLNFQASLNIIRHHLSLEFGPVLNVNGKMNLDKDEFENYTIEGYNTIKASDIEDISKVNVRVLGGLTAGLENFRLTAHYQYGVTNMLKNLNDKELEFSDFKGNSSALVFGAVIYF